MSTEFFEEFNKKKKRLRILILGAYSPNSCEDRLSKFRDFLTSKGYANAKLVKDFPDVPSFHSQGDAHIVAKSQHYIKYWADVLLFVFLNGAMNEGVSIEKLGFSVVFGENGLSLSSMIRGTIQIQDIKAEVFVDDSELCEKTLGYLTNFVHRLYWYL
jgi:hypothetical protein